MGWKFTRMLAWAGLLAWIAALCACSAPPTGVGGQGGTGGTGGSGGSASLPPISSPDRPCAFVETPARPTGNPHCPNGTYAGDFVVASPADVQKLAGCTRVSGSLSIGTGLGGAPALQTLAGLESLQAIDGGLGIHAGTLPCSGIWCLGVPVPQLTSLRGLAELRCVGGDMTVSMSSPPLREAAGLAKLSVVEGALGVQTSGGFVQPLSALRRVHGDVLVTDLRSLPALEVVYGGIKTAAGPVQPGDLPRLSYIGCGSTYPPCRDGVLGCEFSVASQTETNQLATCKYALKNLVISSAQVTDARPLRELRHVRGVFAISKAGLRNLEGLNDLSHVGALSLTDNPLLEDVSALNGLELGEPGRSYPVIPEPNGAINTVGGFELLNNPALKTLAGWSNMRLSGRAGSIGVVIRGNASLESLGNWPWLTQAWWLWIEGSPLASLGGLGALKSGSKFIFEDLPRLASFTGLDNLESVEEFYVSNAGLQSLDGLSKLVETRELRVEGCPKLASVAGLRALERVTGSLSLSGMPLLASLQGLENLETAENLLISGAGITNPRGLSNLQSSSNLTFENCSRFTSLEGMTQLSRLGNLGLTKLPALANFQGMPRLSQLGALVLTDLPALTNFQGIAPLSQLEGLYLTNLPALTSLSGLSNAQGLTNLTLESVPKLASLAGVHPAENMFRVHFKDADAIQNFRGFEQVKDIGYFIIEGAAGLRTVDGLGALERVGGEFRLERSGLESLHGFTSMTYANNGPVIAQNFKLSDCELRWFWDKIGYTPVLGPLYWSTAGPRNCEVSAPITVPGLVWSKFLEVSDESISDMQLLPGNRLALIETKTRRIPSDIPGATEERSSTLLRILSPSGEPLSQTALGEFSGETQQPWCSGVDAAGRITIVSYERYADSAQNGPVVFRVEPDGKLLSTRRPGNAFDESCAVDASGNVYLTTRGTNPTVTKQDPTGRVLWQRAIDVGPELVDDARKLTLYASPSGVLVQNWAVNDTWVLSRLLDDGQVAWRRSVRGSILTFAPVMTADGRIAIAGTAQSDVTTDLSPERAPLPAGASEVTFLLRLRGDDGFVQSLSAFVEPVLYPQLAFGPDGSLYVVSSGFTSLFGDPNAQGAVLFKFDASGRLAYRRDLGPLISAWTGDGTFSSQFLRATSDRVLLAASAWHTDGFLAQFAP
jgi:hypothetical protein